MYRVNGVRKKESTRRRAIYKNKPPIRKDGDLAGSFIVQPIKWSSMMWMDSWENSRNKYMMACQVAHCPFIKFHLKKY